MHSSAGALAETQYVYGRGLSFLLEQKWPVRVISVGLGMGYVELLAAAHWAREGIDSDRLEQLISYEVEPSLRENFRSYLTGTVDDVTVREVFHQAGYSVDQARDQLRRWYREKRFEIREGFGSDTWSVDASLVCYDPFSGGTSPELWSEDFLSAFVGELTSPYCVFTTYASTKRLKRVLSEFGFSLHSRRGFGGKRECTFAVRGFEGSLE